MASIKNSPTGEIIGLRLRQLRELRGESLNRVANTAGLAKSYVARLEQGRVANPGLMTVAALADVLKVSLSELLAEPTGSHKRRRWSSVVDPLEIERIRETAPRELLDFLEALARESGEHVRADVLRTLASIQLYGRRPQTTDDWRFAYLALLRAVRPPTSRD